MEEHLGTGEGELLEEEVKTGTTPQTYIQVFRYLLKLLILYILLYCVNGGVPDQYYINIILKILWQ